MSHIGKPPGSEPGNPYDSMLGNMAQATSAPLFHTEAEKLATEYQPGKVLNDRYEIIHVLGKGVMGIVFLAHDRSRDCKVALKLILPQYVNADKIRQRFLNEVRTLREIDHENVARVQSGHVHRSTGLPYLVMEYVKGETLADYIRTCGGQLALVEVIDIMEQLCSGLAAAHPDLVHLDLKPENVIRQKDGRLKILDFGLARVLDEDGKTRTMVGAGAPRYLSPEQANNEKPLDQRADIYALGVMLYEVLTGGVAMGSFETPSEANPALPRRIDQVVAKAMSKRDERYRTVDEFLQDLRDAAAEKPGGRGSFVGAALAVLALLAIGGAIAIWALTPTGNPPAAEEIVAANETTPTEDMAESASPTAPTPEPDPDPAILQRPAGETVQPEATAAPAVAPEVTQTPAGDTPLPEIPRPEPPIANTPPVESAPATETATPTETDSAEAGTTPVTGTEAEAEPAPPASTPEVSEPAAVENSTEESVSPAAVETDAVEPDAAEAPVAESPAPVEEAIPDSPAPMTATETAAPVEVVQESPASDMEGAETPRAEAMPVPVTADEPVVEQPVAEARQPDVWLRPDLGLETSYSEGTPISVGISGGPPDVEYEWTVNGATVARGVNQQRMVTTLAQTGPLEVRVLLRRDGRVIAEATGTSRVTPPPALPWTIPAAVEFSIGTALPEGFGTYEWTIDGVTVSGERVLRHTIAEPGRYRIEGYARGPQSAAAGVTYAHKVFDTTVTEWRTDVVE